MGQHVTDVGLEKKDKKELKKHAATIHCSNSLSLLQRKITNALLYHAYKELMLKEEHEITVKQLCRLIGYHGNNHAVIKEALKELISTVIEWNLIDEVTGNENWTASSIIASVSLEGPLCYYSYSTRMKQLLHSPSMFGKIDLVIQSKFRSSYGLALYENCIRYRGLPNTKWFEMELFKKLMGVPVGKYDIFRDFKKRVLDKAVDEVNTYSDLTISPEYVKEGRKTVRIRFILKERAKKIRLGNALPRLAADASQEDLKTRLQLEYGIAEEQLRQLLLEYSMDYIREKISLVEASKPYQEGRVENLAGYLLSALKNNYQAPKAKLAVNTPVNLMDAKQLLALSEWKRHVETIREEYQVYRERSIQEAIACLPEKDRDRFYGQFALFVEPTVVTVLQLQRNRYSRDNVYDSPQVKALLRKFALRELDSVNMISLEEFVAALPENRLEAWHQLKAYDPDHGLLHFQE